MSLAWNPDSDSSTTGYFVRYGTTSGVHPLVSDAGNQTTATIANLTPGATYYFTVSAYDADGHESPPSNEVSFLSAPLAVNSTVLLLSATSLNIDVLTNDIYAPGSAQIILTRSPRLGTAVINPDNTITYIPGAEFKTGDSFVYTLTDSTGISSSATVTITDAAIFDGLVSSPTAIPEISGRIRLAIFPGARFKGGIQLGFHVIPIKGTFNGTGDSAFALPSIGGAATTLTLHLDPSAATIAGSLVTGTNPASTVSATLTPFSNQNIASQAGTYTLLLPPSSAAQSTTSLPQGTGYSRMSIGRDGIARLTGRLADGALLNTVAPMAADGTLALYIPLYGGKGFLSGTLKFETITTSGSESDLDGTLEWVRPASPTTLTARFPDGFDATLNAIGSLLTVQSKTATAQFPENQKVLTATLQGGYFQSPVTDSLALSSVKGAQWQNIGSNHISVQINPKTGLFAGNFVDPATKSLQKFSGAVFQKQNTGAGYFSAGPAGGSINLSGNTQ